MYLPPGPREGKTSHVPASTARISKDETRKKRDRKSGSQPKGSETGTHGLTLSYEG